MSIKKILIAVDGGPTAEKITAFGFQLGQQLGAEIAILSVADTATLVTDGGVTPYELGQIEKANLKERHQLLTKTVCENKNLWTFVEEGRPADIILKVSEQWEADLLVLGTHGRRGFSHLMMGSVAEKVVRQSSKPTLIVPTK